MQLSFVFSIHYTHRQHPGYQRQSSSHICEICAHSSVGGGTGGLGPLLFHGCFSVWLDTKEIDDPESYQSLYIHLTLFFFFCKRS